MTPRTIEIDGKRCVWRDILELRRQNTADVIRDVAAATRSAPDVAAFFAIGWTRIGRIVRLAGYAD